MSSRDKVITSLIVGNVICLVVLWPETVRCETRCPLNHTMLFSYLSPKVPLPWLINIILVNIVHTLTNIGLTNKIVRVNDWVIISHIIGREGCLFVLWSKTARCESRCPLYCTSFFSWTKSPQTQLVTLLQKCYWFHYKLNYWPHYKRVTRFLYKLNYLLHYKNVTDFITKCW